SRWASRPGDSVKDDSSYFIPKLSIASMRVLRSNRGSVVPVMDHLESRQLLSLDERERSSMSIRRTVRRNLVPRLDHLDSRQLLSVGTRHFHVVPHRHHAAVQVAPAAPPAQTAAVAAATPSVIGLNKLTNPNFNGVLNATAAVASNDFWSVGTV